ncbi:MAG: hypothetical protein IID44_04195 [Planctomycetes bacterium]|nr:hypothetical protein [Planctomycetota bacterium]
MKLLRFNSYDEYVELQTETNKQKLGNVWVSDKELAVVARYIRQHVPGAAFGICHGVRNGYEVHRLRELLGIDVIGTELSETATEFEHVIQWDFHEVDEAWQGRVDLIYSNSWDHSYDPALMLDRWMSCLTPTGRCFLHWTPDHGERAVGGADCFGASLEELTQMAEEKYEVETVLKVKQWWGRRLSLSKNVRNVLFASPRTVRLVVIKHRTKQHAPPARIKRGQAHILGSLGALGCK